MDKMKEDAINSIRAWQKNPQTTWTPSNILHQHAELIIAALTHKEPEDMRKLLEGMAEVPDHMRPLSRGIQEYHPRPNEPTQDTYKTPTALNISSERSGDGVDNLVMLIRRIAYRHSKGLPVSLQLEGALDYIRRAGLEPSVLREALEDVAATAPSRVHLPPEDEAVEIMALTYAMESMQQCSTAHMRKVYRALLSATTPPTNHTNEE